MLGGYILRHEKSNASLPKIQYCQPVRKRLCSFKTGATAESVESRLTAESNRAGPETRNRPHLGGDGFSSQGGMRATIAQRLIETARRVTDSRRLSGDQGC